MAATIPHARAAEGRGWAQQSSAPTGLNGQLPCPHCSLCLLGCQPRLVPVLQLSLLSTLSPASPALRAQVPFGPSFASGILLSVPPSRFQGPTLCASVSPSGGLLSPQGFCFQGSLLGLLDLLPARSAPAPCLRSLTGAHFCPAWPHLLTASGTFLVPVLLPWARQDWLQAVREESWTLGSSS